jgi:excisionase family DNA binding protein
MGTQKVFYNLEEVVVKLGLSDREIRRLLNEKELKGYKKGNRWYILHDDLYDYITKE